MLKITTTRLRKEDRRRAAVTVLFQRLSDQDYTLSGEEPTHYVAHLLASRDGPPQCIWLTYSATIKRYALLLREPEDTRLIAVTIDRLTLIFDRGMEFAMQPCAVLFKPLPDAKLNSPKSYPYRTLVEQMTGSYTWDYVRRFGQELRAGGFKHVGDLPTGDNAYRRDYSGVQLLTIARLARTDY